MVASESVDGLADEDSSVVLREMPDLEVLPADPVPVPGEVHLLPVFRPLHHWLREAADWTDELDGVADVGNLLQLLLVGVGGTWK